MREEKEAVVMVARRRLWLAPRRLSRAPLFPAPSLASSPLPWPPPSFSIDLPELSLSGGRRHPMPRAMILDRPQVEKERLLQ